MTVAISLIYSLEIYQIYLQKLVGMKFGFHRISAVSPILWHIMFALAVLATGGIQAIFEVRRQKRPVSAVDLGLNEDFIGDGRR